jgi:hypothetical protein
MKFDWPKVYLTPKNISGTTDKKHRKISTGIAVACALGGIIGLFPNKINDAFFGEPLPEKKETYINDYKKRETAKYITRNEGELGALGNRHEKAWEFVQKALEDSTLTETFIPSGGTTITREFALATEKDAQKAWQDYVENRGIKPAASYILSATLFIFCLLFVASAKTHQKEYEAFVETLSK